MMEPLISVIIPVYNVEEYLRQCLDSVINQTYRNLEIILVDDGSTDSSGIMCDQYALTDSRIKVIHKKNGGLSDARNVGLNNCHGEYIGFVDSDDWISHNMFEQAYIAIEKENADVCFFHSAYVYYDKVKKLSYDQHRVLNNKEDMIALMFDGKGQTIAVYLKLYHKKIFDNIRFPIGKTNEDAFIILDVINATTRMVIIPNVLYYYRQRTGSITRTATWNDNIFDTIEAYKNNKLVISRMHYKMLDLAEKRLFWAYRFSLALAASVDDYREHKNELYEIRKEFRKFWKNVALNKRMSLLNIVDSYIAMLLPPRMYSRLKKDY